MYIPRSNIKLFLFFLHKIVLQLFIFRGLLAQSIIRAQVASPTFSNVYAALVAIINTKVTWRFVI